MAMVFLAQYLVSQEQHWHPNSTTLLCSWATRAPWCPRSSGRAANVEEPEDPHARLDASRQRETDLEDARVAVEAELEDACRPAADVLTVLESELEHEHAALEEEHKRTTKLEGRLWRSSRWKSSHPLHGGAILSPGSRSACGR